MAAKFIFYEAISKLTVIPNAARNLLLGKTKKQIPQPSASE